MKITKKLLMKIIKEEMVREAQREVWDYGPENFMKKGRPDSEAYERHLATKRKFDPRQNSREVVRGQYSVAMNPEDAPPLPPATERDIRNGKVEEETDYYNQRVYFYPDRGTWNRLVFAPPGSSTIVHEDRGSLEDYPMA